MILQSYFLKREYENVFSRYFPRLAIGQMLRKKYRTNCSEIHLILDVLECFLIEKSKNKTALLILPQKVDWAWHEFILDTKTYNKFSLALYGGDLPHMKIVPDGDAYNISNVIFESVYGFDTRHNLWSSAGWDSTAYAFIQKWKNYRGLIVNSLECNEKYSIGNGLKNNTSIDFDWLIERLSHRFEISRIAAYQAVELYKRCFLSGELLEQDVDKIHPVIHWAWQEHILWTEKYKRDCHHIFGNLLHRPIVKPETLFNHNIGMSN